MTFTSFGRYFAVVLILFGTLQILVGVDPIALADARQGGPAFVGFHPQRDWVETGLIKVFFGLCLGILTDISRRLIAA